MGTKRFIRSTSVACGLVVLASTLTVAPAASATSHAGNSTGQPKQAGTLLGPAQTPGFEECEKTGATAVETTLGSELGNGASELLTDSARATINSSLVASGKSPLNEDTAALRYLDDGSIFEIGADGAAILQLSASTAGHFGGIASGPALNNGPTFGTQAFLHPEVKRIVGACLGFGGAGGMGFEALVRYLGDPVNAAKFVIRRIGIAGAISCVGGVIWEYI